MNLRANSRQHRRGSTLLTTLFIGLIAAIALGTYLQLIVNQHQLTYRSQTWNFAMALVEAGVEEALEHCSVNSPNLASQGWSLSSGRYSKSNALAIGYYIASI